MNWLTKAITGISHAILLYYWSKCICQLKADSSARCLSWDLSLRYSDSIRGLKIMNSWSTHVPLCVCYWWVTRTLNNGGGLQSWHSIVNCKNQKYVEPHVENTFLEHREFFFNPSYLLVFEWPVTDLTNSKLSSLHTL